MPKNIESDALLAMTARWTVAVRSQESARADRLFDAPWATALAGEVGWPGLRPAPDANYGRWTFPVPPVKIPDMPHNWFVAARRE